MSLITPLPQTRWVLSNNLVMTSSLNDPLFSVAIPFRCLQKFPVPFLKCEVAIPAIHCAVVASTLEHRDANLSVMKFLKCLISCVTENLKV